MGSFDIFSTSSTSPLGSKLLGVEGNGIFTESLLEQASLGGNNDFVALHQMLRPGVGDSTGLELRSTSISTPDDLNSTSASTTSAFGTGFGNSILPSFNQGFSPVQSQGLSSTSVSSDNGAPKDSITGIPNGSFLVGKDLGIDNVDVNKSAAKAIDKDKKEKNRVKNRFAKAKLDQLTGDPTTILINVGGEEYKDGLGRRWLADNLFIDGTAFSTAPEINGTTDDTLYQSGRRGDSFSYQVPLPKGNYTVNLSFVDNPFTPVGQRLFDVLAEDQLVLDDFDIKSQVAADTALNKSIKVKVDKDDTLDLDFVSVAGSAQLAAIEITPDKGGNQATVAKLAQANSDSTSSTPQTNSDSTSSTAQVTQVSAAAAPTALINSGGGQYTDGSGQVWSADQNFTGGNTYSPNQPINGTTDDTLYQSERYGNSFSYQVPVAAVGTYEVNLNFAELYWNGPGLRVFDVKAEGQTVIDNLDIFAEVGVNAALTKLIKLGVTDGTLNLDFDSSSGVGGIENAEVTSIGVRPDPDQTEDPFLHVSIDAPSYAVDYNDNGSEAVALRGGESHTHEPHRVLSSFNWKDGSTVLGTGVNIKPTLSVGQHQPGLTIGDDNSPPRTLTDSVALPVYTDEAVGGVLTRYYPGAGIDSLPASPGFAEVLSSLRANETAGNIGGSSISGDVVIVMGGKLQVATSGTYNFSFQGGNAGRLFLDGAPASFSTPISLAAGTHSLEARIARPAAVVQPAEILASINGAPSGAIGSTSLSHDQSTLKPFANRLSATTGSTLGGETVTIEGVAFFEGDASNQVKVHWGSTTLSEPSIVVDQGLITVLSTPSGTQGTAVPVTVETPSGTSNPVNFTYSGSQVAIAFAPPQVVANPFGPTQAEWGPDGRLYVGGIDGAITIYTFNDDYTVTNTQEVTGIAGLTNNNILGVAFNPFDAAGQPKIYVSHSQLYQGIPSGSSPYSGQVSVLEGPNFSAVRPVVTGLPVSGLDHGVNGLTFDDNGDLLIAVGGMTNAGIPGSQFGNLPESPLSGGILKARLSDPNFNGAIRYRETATGNPNDDQRSGGVVDVVPGVGVSVFSNGVRNPFDVTWTTKSKLYGTVNGPNASFGEASTSATTQSPGPNAPDEVNLLVQGDYYGHPNRNRGRTDDRQNVYRDPSNPSIPGVHTPPLATVESSTNGISEYRATTFNSRMRGNMLIQKWNGQLYNAELSSDGNTMANLGRIDTNNPTSLDVLAGPGGAILGIDYTDNTITVSRPNDAAAVGATVAYDISTWRAPAPGGAKFVIGGLNFGNLGNTTVTIGGKPVSLTSVSSTRIQGTIPAEASPTANLLDVVVNSGGRTSIIPNAFRYLTGSTPPPTPGTLAFSAPTYSVNENGTPVSVVQVTRTGGSSGAVSATVTPTNGTATAPSDYNSNPVVVNFAAGDTTAKTVTIPVVNDTVAESNETINLALGNVTGGAATGSQNTTVLTIVDNDAPTTTTTLINSGGSQYTDGSGRVWAADQNFTGGNTFSTTQPISGTTDDALHQTERYGSLFSYQIPVANDTYNVNLGFAEIFFTASGKRVFDVTIEGQLAIDNLDIFSQVGANAALTQSKQVVVSDGILNINLDSSAGAGGVDSAKISSIEVLKSSTTPMAGTLAFSAPTYSVNENGTPVSVVKVTRTGGSSGAVSATVTPTNGTATAPSDYNSNPVVVNFAAGDTTAKTVTIPIVNDTAVESNEAINLALGSPTGGAAIGSQNTAVLTIVDNDSSSSTLRVEAEDASKVTLATYRRETKSGVPLISLVGGTSNETGTATHTFNGPAGSYNIIVGYYDENDGTASMLARIGGTQVDSWVLNQNLGSAGVSPQNLVRRTIATGRTLNPGTVIQLQGTENADEAARIDFLEFVPAGSASAGG